VIVPFTTADLITNQSTNKFILSRNAIDTGPDTPREEQPLLTGARKTVLVKATSDNI